MILKMYLRIINNKKLSKMNLLFFVLTQNLEKIFKIEMKKVIIYILNYNNMSIYVNCPFIERVTLKLIIKNLPNNQTY